MKKFVVIILCGALTLACSRHSAKIDGQIEGAKNRKLVLVKLGLGKISRLDSAQLGESGKFSFRIKNAEPATFYNLTLDSLGSIMLIAHNGEHIKLQTQANSLIPSCSIKGSENAELLLQLQQNKWNIAHEVDSILQLFNLGKMEQAEANRAANLLFAKQKKYNTAFIVKHATSPVSIMAYYQKFGKELAIFGKVSDRLLLRMLADSLQTRYPKSAYVKALQADCATLEAEARRATMMDMLANAEVLNKPEIEMTDINGNSQKLSALTGKVVLLSFWSAANPVCLMDNHELTPIYKEYHNRGFEIFQISIDENAILWEQSVKEQALPWINLRCPDNTCSALINYGIKEIPANFIINRKGEIVGKNLYGEELKKKIKELLK